MAVQVNDKKLDGAGLGVVWGLVQELHQLHASLTNNPHSVTKSQVGLGNVDNKSAATLKSEIMTSQNVLAALGVGSGTTKFLREDGTWVKPDGATYSVFTDSADGLAPMASNANKAAAESAVGNYYLCADGKYRQLPANAFLNSTYSFTDANPTLAWGTKSKIATVGGVDIHVTMLAKPTYTYSDVGAASSGHTHTTSLAADTGTSAITLASAGKYKLTAGGTSVIFTMPTIPTVSYPVTSVNSKTGAVSLTASDVGAATSGHTHGLSIATSDGTNALTLAANTKYVLTAGGSTFIFTTPADTNTWRPLGTGASDACAGNDSRLSNSRPASDVYAWAKASSKPSYTYSEVGAASSGHTHATSIATNSGTNQLTLAFGTKYALTAGGTSYIFTMPSNPNTNTTYKFTIGSTTKGDSTNGVDLGTLKSETAAASGTTLSLVTTGEKATWNAKSNLALGTSSTTAAAGNHTHGLSIAADTGTNALTLAHGGKYKLTAGGSTFIFTMPTDNNTTYSFADKNVTLAWGTKSTIATVGGVDIHVTMPSNPNTDHYAWSDITGKPSTYTPSAHTHTTSIATSSGTNQLTLAFGTKYAITAGDTSYVFTMPSNPNTWPTKVSQLTNDSGYITSSGSCASATSASYASKVVGSYTSNGGQQKPNYFGTNRVGFLMMNTTVNSNSQYKDWLIMDCYNGNDVGGGVAIGVNRQSLGAYIMRSAAERTSWAESAELLGTHNYASYAAKKTEAIKSISRSGTTFTATRCDGTTFTFTQQDNNTTYTIASLMGSSAKGGTTQPVYWNGSAWANTTYTLGKSVPSDAVFTDTNTWRTVQCNGTSIGSNTLNLKAGTNVSLSNSNGTITITSTDTNTTYSAGTGISLSGTTFSNSGVRSTTINGNYLRVNTNGTNADLTIPYATYANAAGAAGNADTVDGLHAATFHQWTGLYSGGDCSGIYNATTCGIASGANCPPATDNYGVLMVIPYRTARENSSSDFAAQLFFPNGDDSQYPSAMFYRTSERSSWNGWRRIQGESISDIRTKDVIGNVELSLNYIAEAPMIRFHYKRGYGHVPVHVGSVAQYWQKNLPETINQDDKGILSMDYQVIALLSAISVAKETVKLKEKVALLETRVRALEDELADYQAA